MNIDNLPMAVFRDLYEFFIGKAVVIYTDGNHKFCGVLEEYNGIIIKLIKTGGLANTYIPTQSIIAVSSDH